MSPSYNMTLVGGGPMSASLEGGAIEASASLVGGITASASMTGDASCGMTLVYRGNVRMPHLDISPKVVWMRPR